MTIEHLEDIGAECLPDDRMSVCGRTFQGRPSGEHRITDQVQDVTCPVCLKWVKEALDES